MKFIRLTLCGAVLGMLARLMHWPWWTAILLAVAIMMAKDYNKEE